MNYKEINQYIKQKAESHDGVSKAVLGWIDEIMGNKENHVFPLMIYEPPKTRKGKISNEYANMSIEFFILESHDPNTPIDKLQVWSDLEKRANEICSSIESAVKGIEQQNIDCQFDEYEFVNRELSVKCTAEFKYYSGC